MHVFSAVISKEQYYLKMSFNVGKIGTTVQQLGQKLTPDKIHQFGTKVRNNMCIRS